MGTFWEKLTRAISYHVEMLGLCALHLLAQAVAEFYKVDKWAPSSAVTTVYFVLNYSRLRELACCRHFRLSYPPK